ncbi:serine hydrolase domain-containing protein [Paenibacillus sp. UMB7766-LJ446]|uniref:serine hydrolase domain-containing protein n=1 Tax=Paenibacillus sp. UMB7766-LJ446 TaxID=3046313 RepID=UPI00254CF3C6|nr:serine hydrolase domain-containing protein [Paenibacillus sp. UMB7766-LJ446]MDK8191946.1 serine hydrolase domain-containing protein [Paenibacillus sp. UMB7766-LJ446]
MKFRRMFTLLILVVFLSNNYVGYAESSTHNLEKSIDMFINREMKKMKIPGLSASIVQDKFEYSAGYGFRSSGNKAVDERTLFELGSNSKAFTGLALLHMVKQGKLSLDDNVTAHLPWFTAVLDGTESDINIRQLLHHTSGIPTDSITLIPESNDADALKQMLMEMVPVQLVNKPGQMFEYATLNYDIIGLIVAEVSGVSYEEYMIENIFNPLGLLNTFPKAQVQSEENMASGHKLGFFGAASYDGPSYRGNTPSGYIVSNAEDMRQWMKIQLGIINVPGFGEVILESHMKDNTLEGIQEGVPYAAGWEIYSFEGEQLEHSGANPGFSSYMLLNKGKKIGVTVMANLNSEAVFSIAMGIEQILLGNTPTPSEVDLFLILNNVMRVLLVLSLLVIALSLFFCSRMYKDKHRSFQKPSLNAGIKLTLLSVGYAIFTVAIYLSPTVLYHGYPWSFLSVWAPSSLVVGAIFMVVAAGGCFLCGGYSILFPKRKD